MALALLAAGCQDDITTPFPPGLEPFDDDAMAAAIDAPREEALVTEANDDDGIQVYARGYIFAPPTAVWLAAQTPEALIARCQTSNRTITPAAAPEYALDFNVRYVVEDILTVEWTDQWRGDIVAGTPEVPEVVMIKHQKIEGSDFIERSEGTIQLLATGDPNITELQFVEHLEAFTAGADQVVDGAIDTYDGILAVVRGEAIPGCD